MIEIAQLGPSCRCFVRRGLCPQLAGHDGPMPRLRKSMLLLGAFCIGYNAESLTHELGHALAMWATGSSVARITLNPFSWSYTFYAARPTYPLLTAWAGAVFSSAIGLLSLALIRPRRGAWTVPLALMGVCSLVVNGIYLVVDSLFLAGGDATNIILHGTPRSFVLIIGVGLIALGLVLWQRMLPRIGLTVTDSVLTRIAVLEGGVGPYLIAMLVYQAYSNPREIKLWSTYVIIGLLMLAGVSAGSRFIDRRCAPRFRDPVLAPSWATAGSYLIAGTLVVVLELWVCAD
jgi:hypothetical protein